MSSPIPPQMLIRGAAALAGEVARGVSSAVQAAGEKLDFDQVLAGGEPVDDGNATGRANDSMRKEKSRLSATELLQRLVGAVHARLQQAGIELEQPLSLQLQPQGSVRVESNHPQAARVEAMLQRDAGVGSTLQSLLQHRNTRLPGLRDQPIDLTIPPAAANILPASGGYPNW